MTKEEMLQKAEDEAIKILLPAVKQYAQVIVKDIAIAAIQDLVADSENPYDDMLLAAIIPVIDAKIEELVK